jgi:hypothetical protein
LPGCFLMKAPFITLNGNAFILFHNGDS